MDWEPNRAPEIMHIEIDLSDVSRSALRMYGPYMREFVGHNSFSYRSQIVPRHIRKTTGLQTMKVARRRRSQ